MRAAYVRAAGSFDRWWVVAVSKERSESVSVEAMMKPLGRVFGLQFFWASAKERFTRPGLYVWAFKRNVRLMPWRW